MQKKIELQRGKLENSLFAIDDVSFILTDGIKGTMLRYAFELDVSGYEPLDVRFLLEDADPELEFLLEAPEELTHYIKQFEEEKDPNDESLFHDIRTKYIEFVKRKAKDSTSVNEEIMIFGFSITKTKIYIIVKTFSLKLLSAFLDAIKKYCSEREIGLALSENLRWLELNQYFVRKTGRERGHQSNEFLKKTLAKIHFPRFIRIFRKIDRDGYFKQSFYKEIMFQDTTLADGRTKSVPINQVSKFFSPYWKYSIQANQKEILCLHDEMPMDEKIDEYVYSFKPSLFGYYLNYWFEDFTVEIINQMDFSPYTVTHLMTGSTFNFFLDGDKNKEREIDVIINVEKHGISKLIAIECKKTLSYKELNTTNKKTREKVVNSGNNVFDAFIHIGCFSSDVSFEKIFEGTALTYKQGIISGSDKNLDAPFYAFDISAREDYEQKFKHTVQDIFDNW